MEDGDDIMARIYSVPIDSAEVAKHRKDVMNVLEAEKEYNFGFRNLFRDNSPVNVTWRLWLGVLVQFLQQMVSFPVYQLTGGVSEYAPNQQPLSGC